jgi:hypothetical protein
MNMNACMLGDLNYKRGHPFLDRFCGCNCWSSLEGFLDGVTVRMLIGICGVQILSGMSVRGPPSKECLTWGNQRWLKIIELPANSRTFGLLLFNLVVALMPSVL